MTHRKRDWIRPVALTLASGALALCLVACSGEEEAPQAVRPNRPAPPPPAPPKLATVEQLMARLGIDDRIMMAEEDAPDTEKARIAILEFFDGFARGDAGSLRSSMHILDQMEFNALVDSGLWEPTIENIDLITIKTGAGPYGEACAMAIFEVAGDFQPQLWYMHDEPEGYTFEAAPIPPNIMDKLYGEDFIAKWHEIIAEEIALANTADVDIEFEQQDLDDNEDNGSSAGAGPGGTAPSAAPGGGGGAGRRKPGRTRPAPGPGG
jgi:hypothetical protein